MGTEAVTPYAMTHEPPMSFRADGYDYDHEVLVALPPSYQFSADRSYPVLWAMDGAMLFDLTVGIVTVGLLGFRYPEMIVVAVGHPSAEGLAGLARRTTDLFPPGSVIADDDPATTYLDKMLAPNSSAHDLFDGVKGDRFLTFLLDQLRPELGQRYRMADDHALFGHSAGAAFASYAMFARPGGFDRYILGSCTNALTIDLEAEYAATHDDLEAKLFISAGDGEANNHALAAQRMVSRTVLLAETLLLREYPSLRLKTRLYTDADHYSIVPRTIGDGLACVERHKSARRRGPERLLTPTRNASSSGIRRQRGHGSSPALGSYMRNARRQCPTAALPGRFDRVYSGGEPTRPYQRITLVSWSWGRA